MSRQGQVINTAHSNGLNVRQMWMKIFIENEKNFKAKKYKKVLIEKQIIEAMLKAFPDRRQSKNMHHPNRERTAYNRGLFTKGKTPKIKSCKYEWQNKVLIQIKPNERRTKNAK